jgi:hypothetical protein
MATEVAWLKTWPVSGAKDIIQNVKYFLKTLPLCQEP